MRWMLLANDESTARRIWIFLRRARARAKIRWTNESLNFLRVISQKMRSQMVEQIHNKASYFRRMYWPLSVSISSKHRISSILGWRESIVSRFRFHDLRSQQKCSDLCFLFWDQSDDLLFLNSFPIVGKKMLRASRLNSFTLLEDSPIQDESKSYDILLVILGIVGFFIFPWNYSYYTYKLPSKLLLKN